MHRRKIYEVIAPTIAGKKICLCSSRLRAKKAAKGKDRPVIIEYAHIHLLSRSPVHDGWVVREIFL